MHPAYQEEKWRGLATLLALLLISDDGPFLTTSTDLQCQLLGKSSSQNEDLFTGDARQFHATSCTLPFSSPLLKTFAPLQRPLFEASSQVSPVSDGFRNMVSFMALLAFSPLLKTFAPLVVHFIDVLRMHMPNDLMMMR